MGDLKHRLAQDPIGVFDEGELAGLPDHVRRMFLTMIAPGTPLYQAVRLTMHGEIKLRKWTRFTATQLLAPHVGFVWSARAGLISGFDRYIDGRGEMRWKLLGLIPVVHAQGPDVSRSAVGRGGGESVWVPTALLPRFGVDWSPIDDRHLVARFALDEHPIELDLTLDEESHISAVGFQRWGDPDGSGSFALHPFGVEATQHRTLAGLTIPSVGSAGWHFGTDRWSDGIFFRYEITNLESLDQEP